MNIIKRIHKLKIENEKGIKGRQHRIHLANNGKPLCRNKRWKCISEDLEECECIKCLQDFAKSKDGEDKDE